MAFLCEALGVSRGGFYAWLTRVPSARSRRDEVLSARIRSSFQDSDRAYGARQVWHDVLAAGIECKLHAIERLMRRNGRVRDDGGCPGDRPADGKLGEAPATSSASTADGNTGTETAPISSGGQPFVQSTIPGDFKSYIRHRRRNPSRETDANTQVKEVRDEARLACST